MPLIHLSFTHTMIGCHTRYQPARQEQLGVRCLAQGHFDTPRVGSNRQPSDCRTTALTSWAISPPDMDAIRLLNSLSVKTRQTVRSLSRGWKNHTQPQQPDTPHAGHQPGHASLWDGIPFLKQHLSEASLSCYFSAYQMPQLILQVFNWVQVWAVGRHSLSWSHWATTFLQIIDMETLMELTIESWIHQTFWEKIPFIFSCLTAKVGTMQSVVKQLDYTSWSCRYRHAVVPVY